MGEKGKVGRRRKISEGLDYIDIYGKLHSGYTHATKSGERQINIAWELANVLNEYGNSVIKLKENALDRVSDFLVEKFSAASPDSGIAHEGKLKDSWTYDPKYHGVRYIGNTARGSKNEYGYDIPLVNLLEFGSKGKPFMRKTFDENEDEIIKIIIEELNKNGDTE